MTVGGWRPARVVETLPATPSARILRLAVPGWPGSLAGQHVDVRLTAEDGYQAVRSYSLGSYGASETIELGVDEIPDGEVSPYLVRDVLPGDELEVKGPLGGYFVWRPGGVAPVQLIAGGSGVVPLMAMARAATDAGATTSVRLLYSTRAHENAIYRDELNRAASNGGVAVSWVYTRAAPSGWDGPVGRLDDARLRDAVWPPEQEPTIYVCGPTGFVEHVADALVRLGHPPARIRTERFGGA
ncbi:ferredoxin reductase [Microbacterium sp. CPCC 204701]|uniref:ferredoxin reductase n=1 Tax=Microbacterium sp. CPCC 204701 TaxID=2493084 RepID=UPI000FD7ED4C|nr:ferredoxin reductase [Microbacterium sp. CPCC 204701]